MSIPRFAPCHRGLYIVQKNCEQSAAAHVIIFTMPLANVASGLKVHFV